MMLKKTFLSLIAVFTLAACTSNYDDDNLLVTDNSDADTDYSNEYGYLNPDIDISTLEDINPGSQDQLVAIVGDRVFFNFNSANLSSISQQTIERQARWMMDHPDVTLTVEGHCDERGTREFNLALAEKRANSVKSLLIRLGVLENRISTISYGKERPEYLGSNEASWSKNRRSVSVVN